MSKRGENIYKRKDGRWEGRYHKGRKENGQLKYGYIYGKSYTEVKQVLYLYKADYHTRCEKQGVGAIELTSWLDKWLKLVKPYVKASTFFSYTYKLNKYVKPYFDENINELKKENIQRWVEQLRRDTLYPSTIQVVFRILKKCLQSAVEQEFLTKNPCEGVKLPKIIHKPVRALTKAEQRKLERAATTNLNKKSLPILLSLRTGLRIGEVSAIRWEDIDLKTCLLTVSQTLQRVSYMGEGKSNLQIDTPKTPTSIRKIPLGRQITHWLKEYKKTQQVSIGYLFQTKKNPCEPRLISYHFQQIAKKTGLSNVHFHQLRHTFATRCIESKADIASVSALLGHASTKMTLDIYADSMLDQRIKIMRNLDKVI